jgi:hypothetical protein
MGDSRKYTSARSRTRLESAPHHKWVCLLGCVLALAFTGKAISQNLVLPNAQQSSALYDEFSANGVRCRQSLGTAMRFDAGTALTDTGEGVLYSRVIIPLGQKQKRMDCSRIFELELRRQEAELRLLEMQQWELPD